MSSYSPNIALLTDSVFTTLCFRLSFPLFNSTKTNSSFSLALAAAAFLVSALGGLGAVESFEVVTLAFFPSGKEFESVVARKRKKWMSSFSFADEKYPRE